MKYSLSSSQLQNNRKASYINHISHIANIPNPQQIQYMNFTHSIAWTFSKEKKSNQISYNNPIIVLQSKDDILFTPSPDQYNIKDISVKSPTWSINQPYHKKKEKFQGIFNYKLKAYFGIEGPKYTFRPKYDVDGITEGKRIPGSPKKTILPGPGYYEIKDSKNSPVYSFSENIDKKKIFKKEGNKTPGVGAYNLIKESEWRIPCYIFGKEIRKNLIINEESLKYNKGKSKMRLDIDDINSTKSPKWTFYKNDRFNIKPKSAQIIKLAMPGPGAYPYQTFIGKGPKFTFMKEKNNHTDPDDNTKKTLDFPGPTTYYKNIHYSPSGPLFTISKLKRKEINNDKYILSLPDPYTYNPDKTRTSSWHRFPVWTWCKIEKNKKIKDKLKTLGPGQYEYKIDIGVGPKYTFGKRLKKLKKLKIPGPGAYNIKRDVVNSPKYTIGLKLDEEKKNSKIKNKNNAPLILNIPSDIVNNKGFSFPKAERDQKKSKNKNNFIYPGPGDYKIPTSFDNISSLTRGNGFFDPRFQYVQFQYYPAIFLID